MMLRRKDHNATRYAITTVKGYGLSMSIRPISLGRLAENRMKRLSLTRKDLQAARWDAGTEVERPEYYRKYGHLPDGRAVVLDCACDRKEHIVKFYVVSDGR